MKVKFLDLINTAFEKREFISVLSNILSSGNFILGSKVKNFEAEFAKYLKVKYCIGVGNGLEALQISLMALGVGIGDEVITTPISAVATTLAILSVGAKPIFVDVGNDGLINPDLVSEKITKKTKAIIPVHLYGNPIESNKIQSLCKKNNLFLIEDTAQAHGSSFKGKKLGTFGDLGCFSFYPTKNLGAFGDGGAIVTSNKSLAKICREIRDYGQSSKYVHKRFGLNSRLDELQAAFLNVKLKSLDKENVKRRSVAKKYIESLSQVSGLEIVRSNNIKDSNFHLFVIKIKKRNQLKKYLEKMGIQTLVHYPKIIPDQPFLKKEYGNQTLPIARDFVKTCLSIPCHPKMSLADTDYVSFRIIEFFRNQPQSKV